MNNLPRNNRIDSTQYYQWIVDKVCQQDCAGEYADMFDLYIPGAVLPWSKGRKPVEIVVLAEVEYTVCEDVQVIIHTEKYGEKEYRHGCERIITRCELTVFDQNDDEILTTRVSLKDINAML